MGRNRRNRFPERIDNVTITGLADKGFCVGKTDEGMVVFVEKVVPGDVVDVRPFRKKKKVLFCAPLEFHKKSEDRVEPFCQHFGAWAAKTRVSTATNSNSALRTAAGSPLRKSAMIR